MKVVRGILFILNLLLAVGLLLTTVAGGVSPSQSVLPSLAAYAYLPLLAANVLMVVVWLLMGRWEALLSVAAVAVRWSTLVAYLQVGGIARVPDRERHPEMLTLMTYNVHQFRGPDVQKNQGDTVAMGFLGLVREQLPDVLCLQEFARVKHVDVVDSLEVMGYNHYYGTRQATAGDPYGTVVFSRLPITYVTRLDNKKLLVELLCGERKVRVCCIHMDSYRFDDADREEIERARHGEVDNGIRATLGKVKSTILNHEKEWNERLRPVVQQSTVPLVVAGDMNDIPSSWLYCRLSDELRDCFRDQGWGIGPTYLGGFPQFRIDMVFHSEMLHTLSYRRLKCNLSDHYPVMTSMEFVE